MTTVPWITGRRLALSRAIAIFSAEQSGTAWLKLSQGDRDRAVKRADQQVQEWTRTGVLVGFLGQYREAVKEKRGKLIQWPGKRIKGAKQKDLQNADPGGLY